MPRVPPSVLAGLRPDAYAVRELEGGRGPGGGERMDAFLNETDEKNRMPSYGKVAICCVVGAYGPVAAESPTPASLSFSRIG